DALGIQNLAEHGAQGRGVMIDLHAHFGRKRHAVTYQELKEIIEKDKVTIERGDIVCLHTGFAELLLELKKNPTPELLHNTCTGLDGRDEKLLNWISDSGLAVLAADNYAVELFSTTASTWASCGTSPNLPAGCASTSATASSSPPRRSGCRAP